MEEGVEKNIGLEEKDGQTKRWQYVPGGIICCGHGYRGLWLPPELLRFSLLRP